MPPPKKLRERRPGEQPLPTAKVVPSGLDPHLKAQLALAKKPIPSQNPVTLIPGGVLPVVAPRHGNEPAFRSGVAQSYSAVLTAAGTALGVAGLGRLFSRSAGARRGLATTTQIASSPASVVAVKAAVDGPLDTIADKTGEAIAIAVDTHLGGVAEAVESVAADLSVTNDQLARLVNVIESQNSVGGTTTGKANQGQSSSSQASFGIDTNIQRRFSHAR